LLEQIFSLRPLDCKDSARAFPEREAREKPRVILGASFVFTTSIVKEAKLF
jgi:hypothetical protein